MQSVAIGGSSGACKAAQTAGDACGWSWSGASGHSSWELAEARKTRAAARGEVDSAFLRRHLAAYILAP
jgi:hypothetical protein